MEGRGREDFSWEDSYTRWADAMHEIGKTEKSRSGKGRGGEREREREGK
jgi:hypothetical protein